MRTKYISISLTVVIVVSLVAGVIVGPLIGRITAPQTAQAVGDPGTHVADDGVGQLDGTGDMDFTKYLANDGPNINGLAFPYDAVTDAVNHRLFVTDGQNNRVLEFDLDGSNVLIDHIPDRVIGQTNYTGNGRYYDDPQEGLLDPRGLAYDSTTDRLFVSDGANRILVFDLSGGITNGMAASNVIGQATFDADVSAAGASGLSNPFAMAMDEDGQRLFMADLDNHRVLVYDVASVSDGMSADNVLGQPDFDTTTPGLDDHTFNFGTSPFAAGVAYDATGDRLFVTDTDNHRTLIFDLSGGITDGMPASKVLGQSNFTSRSCAATQTRECEPADAAYDEAGQRLFVSDSNNQRVLVYDLSGAITNGMAASKVLGQSLFTTNSDNTTQAGLAEVREIWFDPASNLLYVAQFGNNRISIFDVTAITNGENAVDLIGQYDDAGAVKYTKNEPNNGPNQQGFTYPQYIALDTVGHRLFVADGGNNRVLVYNLGLDNTLSDRVADNVLGEPDFTTNAAETTQDSMSNPVGVVYDSSNQRLFVSDYNYNRVLIYELSGGITDGMNATNVLGQPDFTSNDGGASQTGLYNPAGMALDEASKALYVSDSSDNRVVIFNVDPSGTHDGTGTHNLDGESADNVLGQINFDNDSPATSATRMRQPDGVALDIAGQRVFVADGGNNRVLVFDISGGITDGMAADVILGQTDDTSGGSGTTQSTLNGPLAPLYEPTSGYLYVSDFNNNRIMVFDAAAIVGGDDAIDAYGQTTYTDSGADTSDSAFSGPYGTAWDPVREDIWAVDFYNHRVLAFTPTPTTPTPTPSGGGGSQQFPPTGTSFEPSRITINDDAESVDGHNVLVSFDASFDTAFDGTVTVLLSNDSTFATFIPFTYNLPEPSGSSWPKTVGWDLCFGLPESTCNPGTRTVYARFYLNTPPLAPSL